MLTFDGCLLFWMASCKICRVQNSFGVQLSMKKNLSENRIESKTRVQFDKYLCLLRKCTSEPCSVDSRHD